MSGFEAIEGNLHTTLAAFAHAKPAGEVQSLSGVAVASTAIQYAMFNSAVLTAPVATPRELEVRIGTARTFFEARGLGWSFWICQGWIEDRVRSLVAEVCYRCGLREVAEMPGMRAEELGPPARPLPALDFRPVIDTATRADFSYVMVAGFGIPPAVAREVYESEGTWNGGLKGWVGYRGGAAVTSAATVSASGVTGVYAVGTPPAHRRKGYAEAAVRHALESAGAGPSVLESSEAGLMLYRRMGYKALTRYAVFAT